MKSDLNSLLDEMKEDQIERWKIDEPFPMVFFDPQSSEEENRAFDLVRTIVDFLKRHKTSIDEERKEKSELIRFGKEKFDRNPREISLIEKFEKIVDPSEICEFFFASSFFYEIFLKFCVSLEIDKLKMFGFFFDEIFSGRRNVSIDGKVFRSNLISTESFRRIRDFLGKFVCFHRFFFATSDEKTSFEQIRNVSFDENQERRVVFRIDLNGKSAPIRFDQQENIFVLTMENIFRIEQIHTDETGSISIVDLTLLDHNDQPLKNISERIQRRYELNSVDLFSLAKVFRRSGHFHQAQLIYLRFVNDPNVDRDLVSRSFHYLGRIGQIKGDFSTSLEFFEKSLRIKRKIFDDDHPSIGQTHNAIGLVYQQIDEQDKAAEHFHQALAVWRRAFGKNHLNVAGVLNNLGVVYKRQKKFQRALKYFRRALAIRMNNQSTSAHDLAGSHNNLGAVYVRLGQYELAIEHYRLSLDIKARYLSNQNQSIASTLENLGYVHEYRGSFLQAISSFQKAEEIYQRNLPRDHPTLLRIEQSIERVAEHIE